MQGRPTRRPKLRVFGYHLSGSTGTVFLFGIMVGAVALLELSVLWTGARRTADTTPAAQRPASDVKWRSPTKSATPGSNTNSEPTAQRSHRRPPAVAVGDHHEP
jgi:hypothetical protein